MTTITSTRRLTTAALLCVILLSIRSQVTASDVQVEAFKIGKEGRPILVPIRLDDRTVHFLVDTGAGKTAFDISLKDYLGLKQSSTILHTSAGRMTSDLYACPDCYVGSFNLKRAGTVLCLDLKLIRYASGEEVYGILGMDFLREFAVEIDFDSGCLRLRKATPENWRETGQHCPLTWRGGCPAIIATLPGDRHELFIVDTGANLSTVREVIYDELAVNDQLSTSSRQRSFTVKGEIEDRTGYVEQITLSEFSHRRIRLDRDPMSALGLRYLSRFLLRFDFPNNTMYVSAGARYAERDSVATSGMAILQIAGQKVVYATEPGRAAERAGLRWGDVIEKVDGKAATTLDIFDLSKVLTSEPGRQVEVEIRRRNENFTVQLVLNCR